MTSYSQADRAALRARAAGLREERRVLQAEATEAIREAAAAKQDAKLLTEVVVGEQAVRNAKATKDRAEGTVEAALAAMTAAAEIHNKLTEGEPVPVPTPAPVAEEPVVVVEDSEADEADEDTDAESGEEG